jgi:hypothetical protein
MTRQFFLNAARALGLTLAFLPASTARRRPSISS